MKKLFCLVVFIFVTLKVDAQEIYQYNRDSVIETNTGKVYIIRSYSSHLRFSKAVPAYEPYQPSTCSDPTIEHDEFGQWILDDTKFNKIPESVIRNIVRLCFAGYHNLLKSALNGEGWIWICIRTNAQGVFKNAEVKIWAEPSIYRQIPPMALSNLLNSLDDYQFGIPPEYQCISDHYFRYSVFFKDL